MTYYMTHEQKRDRLAQTLMDDGPGSMEELLDRTGMTETQFRLAWSAVKREVASDAGLIGVYVPALNQYGLWEDAEIAAGGIANRNGDVLTRLFTMERSQWDALLAHKTITPRMYRGLTIVRDELDQLLEEVDGSLADLLA